MTSPQGETYLEFVNGLLNKEYEQRKMIEGRAAVIVTSCASLLTIIVGISVLFSGGKLISEKGSPAPGLGV